MLIYEIDESRYKAMAKKFTAPTVTLFTVIMLLVCLGAGAYAIATTINQYRWWNGVLTAAVVVVAGVLLIVLFNVMYKRQLNKNFQMYSKNGVLRQGFEFVNGALVLHNLSCDSHTKYAPSEIVRIKTHGEFFSVKLRSSRYLLILFNGQTRFLYDQLVNLAESNK